MGKSITKQDWFEQVEEATERDQVNRMELPLHWTISLHHSKAITAFS